MPSLTQRIQAWFKSFRTGPATVNGYETHYGVSQDTYAPSSYGNYLALSSAVYACSNLRARNLADDGEQHFAVAKLVDERRVGLPMPVHVGVDM